MTRFAVLIIEHDGETHYLRRGLDEDGPIVVYPSVGRAERDAAFWRDGLGDEVQSVNVVKAPSERNIRRSRQPSDRVEKK